MIQRVLSVVPVVVRSGALLLGINGLVQIYKIRIMDGRLCFRSGSPVVGNKARGGLSMAR